jgi:hypothetical protein
MKSGQRVSGSWVVRQPIIGRKHAISIRMCLFIVFLGAVAVLSSWGGQYRMYSNNDLRYIQRITKVNKKLADKAASSRRSSYVALQQI